VTHNFKPGDAAVIIRASYDNIFYINMLCEVVSPLEFRFGTFKHQIRPAMMHPKDEDCESVWIEPHCLKPIDDDWHRRKLGSWKEIESATGWNPLEPAWPHIFEEAQDARIQWQKLSDPERWK